MNFFPHRKLAYWFDIVSEKTLAERYIAANRASFRWTLYSFVFISWQLVALSVALASTLLSLSVPFATNPYHPISWLLPVGLLVVTWYVYPKASKPLRFLKLAVLGDKSLMRDFISRHGLWKKKEKRYKAKCLKITSKVLKIMNSDYEARLSDVKSENKKIPEVNLFAKFICQYNFILIAVYAGYRGFAGEYSLLVALLLVSVAVTLYFPFRFHPLNPRAFSVLYLSLLWESRKER